MKNTAISHNLAWLDIARLLSVALVMYGHFASVGGHAPEIPGVIAPGFPLPLMNGPGYAILSFDTVLINTFSTQSAILGVSIFFMVTGYLMPAMLERYSRADFLVNRVFRIFPLLVVATIIAGGFVWLTQGIAFPFKSYLASWTLTYQVFGIVPVIGVLWTLIIEVSFYLVSAIVGRFSILKLAVLQSCLLICIVVASKSDSYLLRLLGNQAVFALMISIGSGYFLAEREGGLVRKYAIVANCGLMSYMGFQFYEKNIGSLGTYSNFGTHLLAMGIFTVLMGSHKLGLLSKLPRPATWLADLVYPVYLLHVALGLATMGMVRGISSNPYFMIVCAVSVTLAAAWAAHVSVEKPFIRLGRSFIHRKAQRIHEPDERRPGTEVEAV